MIDQAYLDACDADLLQLPDSLTVAAQPVHGLFGRFSSSAPCTYVAKGPSAVLAEHGTHAVLATVNEACLLNLRNVRQQRTVDFAFFTDRSTIEASRPAWHTIQRFIMPAGVHPGQLKAPAVPIDQIEALPLERCYVFYQNQLAPADISRAAQRGMLMYSDTATLGMHLLTLFGFRIFDLYGHDGGVGYAPGLPCLSPTKDNSAKRRALQLVCEQLRRQTEGFAVRFPAER